MSAAVIYSIDNGKPPFRVWLLGSDKPLQLRYSTGIYTFNGVDCGEYMIRIMDAEDCLIQFPVSYPCPTTTTTEEITTTTTEEVTTTTTTVLEFPCKMSENFYGTTFESVRSVNIKGTTGAVILDFNTFYIPIKIVVEWDGNEVINTGYRGNPVFQTVLNDALTALGYPTETINPDSNSKGAFLKTSNQPNKATVRLFAPLDGAIATWKLNCPVTSVITWTVEFEDHVCIIEEEVTTTTTTEISTTTTTVEITTTTTDNLTTTTTFL